MSGYTDFVRSKSEFWQKAMFCWGFDQKDIFDYTKIHEDGQTFLINEMA